MLVSLNDMIGAVMRDLSRHHGREAGAIFASEKQIKHWGHEAKIQSRPQDPPVGLTALIGVPIITTAIDTPYIGRAVHPSDQET